MRLGAKTKLRRAARGRKRRGTSSVVVVVLYKVVVKCKMQRNNKKKPNNPKIDGVEFNESVIGKCKMSGLRNDVPEL